MLYNGGFLPGIILLTLLYYYHSGINPINPSGPTRVFTDHFTDHFFFFFFLARSSRVGD